MSVKYHSSAHVAAVDRLLNNTKWLFPTPAAPITAHGTFKIIRDDLHPHPFLNGNKRRKLDALIPELVADGVTDIVTLGGSQSAHTLAVAAAAVEQGRDIRCHLLIRGERPDIPTGNHLYARMLAHKVHYISRSDYVDRSAILQKHADAIVSSNRNAKVAIIPEGGRDAASLLGMIRLVDWLSSSTAEKDNFLDTEKKPCTLVVDSGTGTTVTGIALGIALLKLSHWKVIGVMLAGTEEYYQHATLQIVRQFCSKHGIEDAAAVAGAAAECMTLVPRKTPRKFGNILPGDVARCREIAQQHGGLVLDPIWTLAAWEVAEEESSSSSMTRHGDTMGREVVMVHTGGAVLGTLGLAQRYPHLY